MKITNNLIPLLLVCFCIIGTACHDNKKTTKEKKMMLIEKTLPEIKKQINGKWKLVSGKNASENCEYENTYITFDGNNYIWTEDGKDEQGSLNWRNADTGIGYKAYLMDVFYQTHPAFPLMINGDTLLLQDCSKTGYLYTLVRK